MCFKLFKMQLQTTSSKSRLRTTSITRRRGDSEFKTRVKICLKPIHLYPETHICRGLSVVEDTQQNGLKPGLTTCKNRECWRLSGRGVTLRIICYASHSQAGGRHFQLTCLPRKRFPEGMSQPGNGTHHRQDSSSSDNCICFALNLNPDKRGPEGSRL
jgi:hypothetical protein